MTENPPETIKTLLIRGYRYALSLTHESAQAEDLLQDAWVSVLRAGGPHKRAYLFSAIRSRFLDQQRRNKLMVIEALDDDRIEAQNADRTDDAIFSDTEMLGKALNILRPVEREVLLLSEIEGYTAQEISKLTGHPRGTVLSLIHRSRKKLKTHLLSHAKKEGYA